MVERGPYKAEAVGSTPTTPIMTVRNITGECDCCGGFHKLRHFIGQTWICWCCNSDIAMTVAILDEKGLLPEK